MSTSPQEPAPETDTEVTPGDVTEEPTEPDEDGSNPHLDDGEDDDGGPYPDLDGGRTAEDRDRED